MGTAANISYLRPAPAYEPAKSRLSRQCAQPRERSRPTAPRARGVDAATVAAGLVVPAAGRRGEAAADTLHARLKADGAVSGPAPPMGTCAVRGQAQSSCGGV